MRQILSSIYFENLKIKEKLVISVLLRTYFRTRMDIIEFEKNYISIPRLFRQTTSLLK